MDHLIGLFPSLVPMQLTPDVTSAIVCLVIFIPSTRIHTIICQQCCPTIYTGQTGHLLSKGIKGHKSPESHSKITRVLLDSTVPIYLFTAMNWTFSISNKFSLYQYLMWSCLQQLPNCWIQSHSSSHSRMIALKNNLQLWQRIHSINMNPTFEALTGVPEQKYILY